MGVCRGGGSVRAEVVDMSRHDSKVGGAYGRRRRRRRRWWWWWCHRRRQRHTTHARLRGAGVHGDWGGRESPRQEGGVGGATGGGTSGCQAVAGFEGQTAWVQRWTARPRPKVCRGEGSTPGRDSGPDPSALAPRHVGGSTPGRDSGPDLSALAPRRVRGSTPGRDSGPDPSALAPRRVRGSTPGRDSGPDPSAEACVGVHIWSGFRAGPQCPRPEACVRVHTWLMAMTTGTPYACAFSMWRARLAQPFVTSSTFSVV
eukprot:354242-Chlamydomonas_euryale.AAC.1